MGCSKFLDYHLHYLKCDVLLLADVFENFRTTSFDYYSLDPANYLSLPSFAWDAMLNMTGIKLEQIHDYRVMDIMERQKKGGLCFVGSIINSSSISSKTSAAQDDMRISSVSPIDAVSAQFSFPVAL